MNIDMDNFLFLIMFWFFVCFKDGFMGKLVFVNLVDENVVDIVVM